MELTTCGFILLLMCTTLFVPSSRATTDQQNLPITASGVKWKREPLPTSSSFNRTRMDGTKFLLRKCCGPGQVYVTGVGAGHNGNDGSSNSSQRCVDYAASTHQASTLIEVSQQLFFARPKENGIDRRDHPNADDFEIDSGFPRNCSAGGLMLLEPEAMLADRFYPLASGQLVVPHRFWLFEPDSQCMEDFFFGSDFNKVRRSAIICTDQVEQFPDRAVDREGKLLLDFIQQPEDSPASPLMDLVGRKVVHKCCDINEVYSVANHSCMPKQGYATQYFDDMVQRRDGGAEIFFRIGLLECPDQQQAAEFELTPSGRLKYKLDEGEDWAGEAVDYCLDDFVVFSDDDLPETINLASFCPRLPTDLPDTTDDPGYPVESSADSAQRKVVGVPKCCPVGQIMENNTCQPFKLGDVKTDKVESIVLRAYQQLSLMTNVSSVLISNVSLTCGYGTSYPLLQPNTYALAKPIFRPSHKGDEVSLSLHYFVENYWDFNVTLKPFCLDLQQFRTSGEVYYEPSVWYCMSPSHVSGHYPILLYISSAALVATFIIYFITPASGAARFASSLGGRRSKQMSLKRRPVSMAVMLTGRNLLCHIFALTVTFIALAIGQQEIIMPGEDTCTALGYVIYGASMASFAWLTVYCFDYCWMFRGSFKVSDTMLFIPYSTFGWGVPILTLIVASVSQFGNTTAVGLPPSINPNMGLIRCWFAGDTSALVFFYVPVSLLLTLNFAFFLRLLFNPNLMNCTKKGTNGPQLRINRKKSNGSSTQDDFKMAVKLFFIAGIPWVFEILAWLPSYLPDVSPTWRRHTVYLFEVSNLLNSLRGVIVFIIFVLLQRDARRHIWLRLRKLFNFNSSQRGNESPGPSVGNKGHPRIVAGSLSALSASSQRTLQSQLSSISASSDISDAISYEHSHSRDGDLTAASPTLEVDEITYL